VSGLTGEVLKLLGEVVGVGLAVGGIALVTRRRNEERFDVRSVAATALGALVLALALISAPSAGSVLNQARHNAVIARAGREHCLFESLTGERPVLSRLPFIDWLTTQLPVNSVYTVVPYSGPPDFWCVTFVLLPALPAGPGGVPQWTITLGTVPRDLQARIARHDPSVHVFAPGYVLARDLPQ
jgi:hypothetical protein